MSQERPTLKNPIKIGPIIGIVFIIFIANGCYSSHRERQKETKYIPVLKAMMEDNTVAVAKVDPVYKEVSIKVMGVPMKHYEVTYTYKVNGQGPYNGERTLSAPPTSAEMPLYYAKSDPSYSSFEPQEDIKRITEKASSNSNLYWSIGWWVIAFLATFGYLSEAWNYLKAKKAIRDAENAAYHKATNY
ncbi:hypothetical protein [Chitinophaga sp. CF418]|uniref:hypothetical protein n=1 Tax=Chitinophaga sp. CF418 TaxID=1855287 RepID=UPI0009179CC3|nr:hypothetical protein [Chitinophaga sp. CF418]SHN33871.1 hypothetical protein SAMN05216311_109218 [Chitinophaga sp. CF418]